MDRLGDLKRLTGTGTVMGGPLYQRLNEQEQAESESGPLIAKEVELQLFARDLFTREVVGIKTLLADLDGLLEELRGLFQDMVVEYRGLEEIKDRIEACSTEFVQKSKKAKKLLDQMESVTTEYEVGLRARASSGEEPGADSGAEVRIRRNLEQTLARRLGALVGDFQHEQTEYKFKTEETIRRQFKIAKGNANEEEIQEALATGNMNVFISALHEQQNAQAVDALRDVQTRHQEIIKLERSIGELAQMFQDLAILVDTQGQLLDRIEYNVAESKTFVGKGVDELRRANQYAKKARKRQCCLVIIVMVVLVVILLPMMPSISGSD